MKLWKGLLRIIIKTESVMLLFPFKIKIFLLDEHIDKHVRMMNIFCKISPEEPIVISANVY